MNIEYNTSQLNSSSLDEEPSLPTQTIHQNHFTLRHGQSLENNAQQQNRHLSVSQPNSQRFLFVPDGELLWLMNVTPHLQPLVFVQLLHVVSTTGRIWASCLTHALTTTNTHPILLPSQPGQVHICGVIPKLSLHISPNFELL